MSRKLHYFLGLLMSLFLINDTLHAQCMGGMLTTRDGATTAYVCVNDGDDDKIRFVSNSLATVEYAFLITDDNNQILAIEENSRIDFEDAGVGDCRVWGLSYEGELNDVIGQNAGEVDLASGCFDLSENYVEIIRREVLESDVFSIGTPDDDFVEITDNDNATVNVFNTTESDDNYVYVLTRDDEKIIQISEDGFFDLSELDQDEYSIIGYSFSGDIILGVGNDLDDAIASGCIEESDNDITVEKNVDPANTSCNADGAMVTTVDGATMAYVCVGDDNNDYVGFDNTSIVNGNYIFVITDENNIILGVAPDNFADFEDAGVGVCRVWGLSFQGELLAMAGDDAAATILATECFDLSDNFITIVRTEIEETEIATAAGEDRIEIDDNEMATFSFANDGAGTSNYVYFITRSDNRIVAISDGTDFNFAALEPAKYFVYGYSYSGDLTLGIGSELEGAISTGCFRKSDNLIFVRKNTESVPPPSCVADAGTITADASSFTIVGGTANVNATPNGDIIIPNGFDVVYILTSGPNLVVQMFSPLPNFFISEPGDYTIHTFVAELNDFDNEDFFDGSGIILNETTGADVLAAIDEQDVCASLDVMGASFEVLPEVECTAGAGILMTENPIVEQQFLTIINAMEFFPPVVPLGYEVTYLLAYEGTIIQSGDNPVFLVNDAGAYNIFTLVAETSNQASPNFLDLSTAINFGVTTKDEFISAANELPICLAIDAFGVNIVVLPATAEIRSNDVDDRIQPGEGLTILGNPVGDYLRLQLTAEEVFANSGVQIIVTNLNGQTVLSRQDGISEGFNDYEFEVSGLQTGIYQISIMNGSNLWTEKFIKK